MGRPEPVKLVFMFRAEMVTLLGAREPGSVQVFVALPRPLMDAFAANSIALADKFVAYYALYLDGSFLA